MLRLALAGIGAAANAELTLPTLHCQDPQKKQTLVLKLEARSLSVNGKTGLHWVIDPLPTTDEIPVSDPRLKSAIEGWIANQNKVKHVWVLDGRTPWSLFSAAGLNGGVASAGFNITFPFMPPPSVTEAPESRPVDFCAAAAEKKMHLDTLEIQVVSEGYDFGNSKPAQPLNASLTANVTASALLSEAEANGDTQAQLNAFSVVAETAWNIARQNGIAIGIDADEPVLRKAEVAVASIYNMVQSNIPYQFWGLWPEPQVFFLTKAGKCCILQVQNVRMATGADIRVEANLPSSAPPSTDHKLAQKPDGVTAHPEPIPADPLTPQNPRQTRAANQAERTKGQLTERFRAELAGFHNTVPTFHQVEALRSHLAAAQEVYPTVRLGVLEGRPRVIVFDTDNRWTIANVKLSAGAGYTVEDKASGKIDFQGGNLIGQLFNHRDNLAPQETESLTYSGGNEVQKANANWGLSWTHTFDHGAQSTYGPQVSGDFLQDHNQRFGNETGPVLRDHEIGWGLSIPWSWASARVTKDGDADTHLFGLNADAGLKQRWFRITPATGNLVPPNAKGDFTAFFVNVTPGYHYVPVRPLHCGGIDVAAEAHFLQGVPSGGYLYTQVLGAVHGTVYFGFSHPRDFFVRFRKGIGMSNGTTPLPELFRLGGTDNTRGVEQGEQVGRVIALEQSEAGISARQIVSWFEKLSHSDAAPKSSPIDLTKIFAKAFYDRGRVSTTGSFTELVAFNHGAKGYGIAVEIQTLAAGNKRISLTLGYARSPDSVLHSNGVPITSAAVDF